MTCPEFETMVGDLAGDRLMEATTRRRLTAHAEQCSSCASRLEAERALNEHLAILAETTDGAAADPALKRDLLAAFSTRYPQRSHLTLQKIAPQHSSQQRWLLAAAALILAMLGVATIYFRSVPKTVASVDNRPGPNVTATIAPSPLPAESERKSQEPKSEEPSQNVMPRRQSRPANMRTVGSPTLASITSEETTTDYLPLTFVSDQTSLQGGVVVRIEIPRATLLAMGLPMNSERANSLVKADVVVGDDGVARAIRLVQ